MELLHDVWDSSQKWVVLPMVGSIRSLILHCVLGSWIHGYLPLYCFFLLFTREIIQIPMVPYFYRLYVKPNKDFHLPLLSCMARRLRLRWLSAFAALLQVNWVLILTSILVCIFGTLSTIMYMRRDIDLFSKSR